MLIEPKTIFECDFCGKKFLSKNANLLTHIQTHNKFQDNYECKMCNKDLNDFKAVYYHFKKFHNKNVSKYEMDCYKKYQEKSKLNVVLPNVGKKKLFHKIPITKSVRSIENFCEYCRKRFKHPSQLAAHMQYHGDKRPYKCSYCNRRFKSDVNLQIHSINHQLKIYECKFGGCARKFSFKQELNDHKKLMEH